MHPERRLPVLFARGAEGPVTIVFGTFGWRETVLGWMDHAAAAGCRHYRIVCLDDELARFLAERGAEARAVGVRRLLPEAPLPDLEAMEPRRRLMSLVSLRVRLFARLAASGCDFIHSDADAFWLRDPRPWMMARPSYDLLCSQGTIHPRAHYHRHRFVLCAGFFLCRANERSARYFAQVRALERWKPDDQARMNEVLMRDPRGRWAVERPAAAIRTRRGWDRAPFEPGFTRCARFIVGRPVSRALMDAGLRAARRDWILTSPEVIEGRFSHRLTVGIMPMDIVARGEFRGWGEPFVRHSSRNKRG